MAIYLVYIAIAIITFQVITCFVLVGCLYLATRFKWTRDEKKDTRRTRGYVAAVIATLVCQILELVTIATNTLGPRYWIIIYILEDLFVRVAEFLVLSVVAWTVIQPLLSINQSTSRPKRVLRGITVFLLGSVAVLSLVCFALSIASSVHSIAGRYSDNAIYLTTIIFLIAVESLYLLCCVLLAICATYFLVRERSKATLLLLFVVICLTLHHTFKLPNLPTNVNLARFFIDIFTTMAIYLIIAVVAMMQPYRILAEEE